MAKIKLTKTELKKQKDSLKRFKRYLPTLQLKKQQLQLVIRQVEVQMYKKQEERDDIYSQIQNWIALFSEETVNLSSLVIVNKVDNDMGNIAGVDIPIFNFISFKDVEYDLFETPLWVDKAIEGFKEVVRCDAELGVLREQHKLLSKELRTTSQRVNLFEKVKIPETKSSIRRIQIALGDEQTAAVVRGKMSKNKIAE